jgi:hypothetical protein
MNYVRTNHLFIFYNSPCPEGLRYWGRRGSSGDIPMFGKKCPAACRLVGERKQSDKERRGVEREGEDIRDKNRRGEERRESGRGRGGKREGERGRDSSV